LASKLHLPIIVHDRDAHDDIVEILERKAKTKGIQGVIHCFSGDESFARKMINLGFYLSFAGNITFKNAEALRQVIRCIPLESMLIETDSPYLTPVPHRGKRNEPSYVKYVAEQIMSIKNISLEEVAKITTANAQKVFNI
jgi:TatD DNase family protein